MDVRVRLANDDLWTKFHTNTTEMVVTKTGSASFCCYHPMAVLMLHFFRKMFPKLEYLIEGLDVNLAYGLVLQIEQVDDSRYKFSGGEWSAAGRGETGSVSKNVMHHDGVMPGAHWMRQPVNFERVKITNNFADTNPSHVSRLQSCHLRSFSWIVISQPLPGRRRPQLPEHVPVSIIFLQSMHKYIPVLSIFEIAHSESPFLSASTSHPPKQVARIRLRETEFIAVTAYQNSTITQLKIEHNPFAKGFRDGGERKRSTPEDCSAAPSPKRVYSPHQHPYAALFDKPMSVASVPSPLPVPPMWSAFYPAYWNPYSYMLNPFLARFGAAPK
ncbi:unnamed protein product [Heligmosomoides polygyrus]|uniref:T-box domain-containing protein n=1 Tax=Heligmosomoides polygyrus TaxID=6339 RepID=A0A3P8BNJ2_HELPZ|nr:unnamed protein product [Heligmosomoides polygyrus]